MQRIAFRIEKSAGKNKNKKKKIGIKGNIALF